ncbi:NAD(P)H-dependent oxidoreductase [bacterium]|nr:NAD(P)H-dependent oxidoreductase [bacterium]
MNRIRICSCPVLKICAFLLMFGSAAPYLCDAQEKTDVLIVYSSGTPHEAVTDIKPGTADAVTCPTPKNENMATVAEKLAAELRKKGLIVRAARSDEILDHNDILDARYIVFGSPSYFGNISWQMKKLIDEKLQIIYMSVKGRFNKRSIAVFSMAEVEPSARETIGVFERVFRDLNAVLGPTMIILAKYKPEEADSRVQSFAEEIVNGIK